MNEDDVSRTAAARPPLPGIERRTAPRVELQVGVGFHSDTNFYTGFTEDVSEGGLFVATHVPQPIGTRLRLTFTLPAGPEITGEAVVRWLRVPRSHDTETVPGMGVQFEGLEREHEALIREFIALREPLFYDA
jgi:uncharacterized protein (TIGR02266 family)